MKEMKDLLVMIWIQLVIIGGLLGMILGHGCARAHADELPIPKLRIAIVDTGFVKQLAKPNVVLCDSGHYDFVTDKPGIGKVDEIGSHGTYIANIIAEDLTGYSYCIVVYRVFDASSGVETLIKRSIKAFTMSTKDQIVAINYSLQGLAHSYLERDVMEKTTDQGVAIFVAAGNDNMDLDSVCSSYPGCYSGISGMVVVGAVSDSDPLMKASYSNYGSKVDVWKSGTYFDRSTQTFERGTSFAAPRALADYVRFLSHKGH